MLRDINHLFRYHRTPNLIDGWTSRRNHRENLKVQKCIGNLTFGNQSEEHLHKKLWEEGLSIRQIGRLTGISKGIVERCEE
jgi:hypothetical protein